MKRIKSADPPSRQRKRSKALKADAGLDATSRETIELFALLLARWDLPREAAWRYLKQCLANLPASIATTSDESPGIKRDQVPGEVLTQWHLLPQYVDNGEPRPLPATGLGPSIASIVRRVSRTARSDEVLTYLLGIGAVKQMGGLYLPQHEFFPRGFRTGDDTARLVDAIEQASSRAARSTQSRSAPSNRPAAIACRKALLGESTTP
jgi:hypothetical protein